MKKDMWPSILRALQAFVEEARRGNPEYVVATLAECVPCSTDYLYKMARLDRCKRPGHHIVAGLARCLDIDRAEILKENMDDPEMVQNALDVEAEVPDILADLATLVRDKGAQSPEIEKIRAELAFMRSR